MVNSSGRTLVIIVISVILVISIFSWFPSPELKDITRFLITCLMCWFIYQKKNWARFTMAILLLIAGLMGLIALITGIEPGSGTFLVLSFVVAAYFVSACILFFSKEVKKYFLNGTTNS